MDIKEAKRKKRNQVLQMFIAALVFDLWSYYIIKTAPKETIFGLMKHVFFTPGYGWPQAPHGIIIIIGIICTILFFVELKQYLQGNYKLWKTGKEMQ
jgi:uncharacterized membrane protein (DUF106 family)